LGNLNIANRLGAPGSPLRTNAGAVIAHHLGTKATHKGDSPFTAAAGAGSRDHRIRAPHERKLIGDRHLAVAHGLNPFYAHQIQPLLDRVPGLKERLVLMAGEAWVNRANARADTRGGPASILKRLQSDLGLDDPADQFLALHFLASQAKENPGSETGGEGGQSGREQQLEAYLLELEGALEELQALHGSQSERAEARVAIFGGLNSSAAAAEFGATPEESKTLQQTYRNVLREVVLGSTRLIDALQLFLQRFGNDLNRNLEFFQKALSDDLGMEHSSFHKEKLQLILTDFFHARVIATLNEDVGKLQADMESKHGRTFDLFKLINELVRITSEQYIAPSRFDGMVRLLEPAKAAAAA
jgi:hypothetical protein